MTEPFGVRPTVENLSAFLGSLSRVSNAYARQENFITRLNKTTAALGSAVDAATRKQVAGANKSAQAFSNAFKVQASANREAVKMIARSLDIDGRLLILERLRQLEAQKTATAEVKAGATIEASRNRVLLQTRRLAEAQRRLTQSFVGGGGGIGGGGGGGGLNFFASLSGFFGKASAAGKVVTGVLGGIGKAFQGLLGPLARIKNEFSLRRIFDVAAGVLIRDVIFGILRTLKDATTEVLKFGASLQTLSVRFETLISRELRQRDATLSVADSLAQAAPQARGLLEWIKQLALVIPIDVADIATTNAYAQAMGFTTTEAKKLTTTILTFTAAMGLESMVAERIVFNFGQMIKAGKLTQTELRDLARGALFPLQDVLDELAKQMGITGKGLVQLREDAAAGKFDIKAFFEAFETVVERDFPGALQRMGQTFQGAMTRLRNFFKVILGGDVFGPVIAQIGVNLSALLDSLNTPELRTGAKIIGETLARSFSIASAAIGRLLSAIGQMLNAFGFAAPTAQSLAENIAFIGIVVAKVSDAIAGFAKTIGDKFGATFQAIIRAAFSWGANIITSLARGMASAVTAVINVLVAIGNIIASWLSPGSPPKIAPLIDRWGAEAAGEWIRGWLKADFSLFNNIADKIEGFLRSIPGGIGADNQGLIPLILGTRETIAQAMNQVRDGAISVTQAINRVMSSAQQVTGEFRTYISTLFEVEAAHLRVAAAEAIVEQGELALAEATERTRVAQDQVREITERYNAILEDLRHQLSAVTEEFDDQVRLEKINAALATGLLTAEEQRRLEMEKRAIEIKAQIRATEAQMDVEVEGAEAVVTAREAEEEAQRHALELAEQQVAAAEIQLDMAEEQLAAAEAAIDFQTRQNELLSEQLSLLEQLAAAAAAAAAGGGEIPVSEVTPPDFGGLLEDLFDEASIQAKVDEIFRNMLKAANDWMKKIHDAIAAPFESIFAPGGPLDQLKTQFDETMRAIAESQEIKKLTSIWGFSWNFMLIAFQNFKNRSWVINQDIKDQLDELFDKLGPLGDEFRRVFGDVIGSVFLSVAFWVSFFLASVLGLGRGFAEMLKSFNDSIDGIKKKLEEGDLPGALWLAFTTGPKLIVEFIKGFVDEIKKFFTNLKADLVGNSIVPDMMDDIYDVMTGTLEDIRTFFEEKLAAIKTFFETTLTSIKTFLSTKMTEIKTTVSTVMTEIKTKWDTIWTEITTFLSTTITTAINNFKNNVLTPLRDYIANTLHTAVTNLKEKALDPLRELIATALTNAMNSLRTGAMTSLRNYIVNILQGALDNINDILGNIASAFNSIKSAIERVINAVERLIRELKKLANLKLGPVQSESPPPLAEGLKEIGKQANKLANGALKNLVNAIAGLPDSVSANLSGIIGASNLMQQSVMAAPAVSSNSIDRSIHVEINPTYRNVQSEASIFYDVSAALSAMR